MLFIVAIGLALGGRKMCESPSLNARGRVFTLPASNIPIVRCADAA